MTEAIIKPVAYNKDSEALQNIALKLDSGNETLKKLIRDDLDLEEMKTTAIELAREDSKLRFSDPNSILIAMRRACQLGLSLNKDLAFGHLIPRRNGFLSRKYNRDFYEATFQTGYRGLMHLARLGNKNIHSFKAMIVYQDEVDSGDFQFTEGTDSSITHNPTLKNIPDARVAAVYSVITFHDHSKPDWELMRKDEIDHVQKVASSKTGPWVEWYLEMVKKSVIRRHTKRLELSPEIQERIRTAEKAEVADDELYKEQPDKMTMPTLISEGPPEDHDEENEYVDVEAADKAAQEYEPVETNEVDCPRCGGPMKKKEGKFGAFYSCVRYPDCKGTEPIPSGGGIQ